MYHLMMWDLIKSYGWEGVVGGWTQYEPNNNVNCWNLEYKPYQVFMYGMKTCHEYENSYPLSALVPKSKLACYLCYHYLQDAIHGCKSNKTKCLVDEIIPYYGLMITPSLSYSLEML